MSIKQRSAAEQTAVEFKLDLIWKLIVLGAFALAGRLAWRAFERMEDAQITNEATHSATLELLHSMGTRVSVAEFQLRAHDARIRDAEAQLKSDYRERPSK